MTADHNSNTSQNTFEFLVANKVVNETTYKIPQNLIVLFKKKKVLIGKRRIHVLSDFRLSQTVGT